MREKKYHLYLTADEQSKVIQSLIDLKNNLIAQGRYTDAVDDVLLKVNSSRIYAVCFQPKQAAFLLQKNFLKKFSEKRRFWVCISYPFVQMSEGVNSE